MSTETFNAKTGSDVEGYAKHDKNFVHEFVYFFVNEDYLLILFIIVFCLVVM